MRCFHVYFMTLEVYCSAGPNATRICNELKPRSLPEDLSAAELYGCVNAPCTSTLEP